MAFVDYYLPIVDYVLAELIVNCVVVLLVVATVGLRVAARLNGPGLGWDDALIIFSVPLGIGMLICQGIFAPIGNGYSMIEHPELAYNVTFILKLTFGMQAIYVTLLAAVKASMLSFFIRIFVTPVVQRTAKSMLVVVALWWIAYLCACIFLCNPIEAQWTGLGTCGEYIPMIQSLIATNAITDFIIMLVPMHSIWSLKMRTTDKIGITSCFALGLACIVCAVFRLIYISTVDLNTNVTGTMPTTVFLFTLEPNLAILCCSIPMLRPYYVMYRKRVGGSQLYDYSNERSTGYAKQSRSGQGSRVQRSMNGNNNINANRAAPGNWEMDDYYERSQAKQGAKVATHADESGSETDLTTAASSMPKNAIGVETKWTVEHHAY